MATNRFKGKESVMVRRALKRARVFEIRKLIKKIRLYDTKKGSDKQLECFRRKKERFIEEMDTMKDFDVGEMANSFVREASTVKDMLDMKQLPSDMKERAKWRLVNCESVKQQLLKSVNASIQPEGRETSKDTDSSEGEGGSISDLSEGGEEEKGTESENNSSRADYSPDSKHNLMTTEGSDTVPILTTTGQRTKLSQLRKSRKKLMASTQESGKNLKGMDSLFVTSLAVSKKKRNEVKNRLGQRARRQLWEKTFKEKANHLKTKTDGKRHQDKSHRQTKRSKQFNTKEKPANKTRFNKGIDHHMNEEDEGPLHPSWEASRVRKEQQSIQSFQGSRIVFSDSD